MRIIFGLISLLFFISSAQEVGDSSTADIEPSTRIEMGTILGLPMKEPEAPIETGLRSGIPLRGDTRRQSLENRSFNIVEIDTCNKQTTINFEFGGGERCRTEREINPLAVDFINANLFDCAFEGLKAVGNTKKIRRIVIGSQGAYARRAICEGCVWSTHSLGTSIDMNHLQIEFTDGSKGIFPTAATDLSGNIYPGFSRCRSECGERRFNKRGSARFFVDFRKCMNDRIYILKTELQRTQGDCTGGLLDCDTNADHNNHIHLSVPFCPQPKNTGEI